MRAILAGSPRDRSRIRSQLEGTFIEIVGEVLSAADARRSDRFDVIIIARHRSGERRPGEVAGEDEPPAEPLTKRETQVLELMAEGLPNKAIADALGISDQTDKFHVASIAG